MVLTVVLWCVLAPAMVTLLGSIVCWRIDRKSILPAGDQNVAKDVSKRDEPVLSLTSLLIALTWWVAVCMGLYSSDSLGLWTAEAWPKIVWPILAAAILVSPHFKRFSNLASSGEKACCDRPGNWVFVGLIAVAAASLAMPTGEGWNDMLPLHQSWIAAIAMATICNTFALYRLSHHHADRWLPLVLLAGLACPTLICAAAYGALAQTCLAAVVATAVIAILTASGKLLVSSALILPCTLFTTAMIAAGRFYSYAEISPGDYGVALLAPSIIALVDRIFMDKSTALRVAVASATGTAIVGFIAYRFLLS